MDLYREEDLLKLTMIFHFPNHSSVVFSSDEPSVMLTKHSMILMTFSSSYYRHSNFVSFSRLALLSENFEIREIQKRIRKINKLC